MEHLRDGEEGDAEIRFLHAVLHLACGSVFDFRAIPMHHLSTSDLSPAQLTLTIVVQAANFVLSGAVRTILHLTGIAC